MRLHRTGFIQICLMQVKILQWRQNLSAHYVLSQRERSKLFRMPLTNATFKYRILHYPNHWFLLVTKVQDEGGDRGWNLWAMCAKKAQFFSRKIYQSLKLRYMLFWRVFVKFNFRVDQRSTWVSALIVKRLWKLCRPSEQVSIGPTVSKGVKWYLFYRACGGAVLGPWTCWGTR